MTKTHCTEDTPNIVPILFKTTETYTFPPDKHEPLTKKMNRIFGRSRRFFCSKIGGKAEPDASHVIRSGGKSSYIGFGKFEGMTREGGSIQKGLEYLKEALKAHSAMPVDPEQRRQEARYHHDIAMCHHREGDIDSAISEYKLTVAILDDLLVSTPSSTPSFTSVVKRARFDMSSALSGLSVAFADKSEDSDALEFAMRALDIRKSVMGSKHASVAECLNNLGGLYFRQGNFNKAADMYQDSLSILLTKTAGKEENKYVALAYYNIGLTYTKLGIPKGADAVRKALLIAEHVWGPDHDQTIQIGQTLAQMKA